MVGYSCDSHATIAQVGVSCQARSYCSNYSILVV